MSDSSFRWIPVSMERPPYGVRVFVAYSFDQEPEEVVRVSILGEDGRWRSGAFADSPGGGSTPSWWMAMPEHPEAENMRRRKLVRKEECDRAVYERLKKKFAENKGATHEPE